MSKIPAGYISRADADAELGPPLIGPGWIKELTKRERWLVEKHTTPASSINPGVINYVTVGGAPLPFDERTELGAALNRHHTWRSQREQMTEWYEDRDLLSETDDGEEIVPVAEFKAALERGALIVASATPSRSSNRAERRCEMWLRTLAIPDAESDRAPIAAHRKGDWWAKAKAREDMKGLSRRGFDRAWTAVARNHPTISQAGAKPKPGGKQRNRITAPK